MRGRLITLITILCFVGTATAQDIPAPTVVNTNDFRGRVEGSFEFEPIKDLSFEAGVQLRLNNDLGSVDRIHTSLGV